MGSIAPCFLLLEITPALHLSSFLGLQLLVSSRLFVFFVLLLFSWLEVGGLGGWRWRVEGDRVDWSGVDTLGQGSGDEKEQQYRFMHFDGIIRRGIIWLLKMIDMRLPPACPHNLLILIIMFVNQPAAEQRLATGPTPPSDHQLLQIELSSVEAHLGRCNPYLFLRSIWKSRSYESTNLDDHFDRLNKVVAMMKSHIRASAVREVNCQASSVSFQEPSSRQIRALEKMSNAMMEKQEYETRVVSLEETNKELSKINEQLREQVRNLKKEQGENKRSIRELTRKNIELENKLLHCDYQSKSQSSFVPSARKEDKDKDTLELKSISLFNSSKKILTDRTPKHRYSAQVEEAVDNTPFEGSWMEDASEIMAAEEDESRLSISSYCLGQPMGYLNKVCSQKEDKENSILELGKFTYESSRDLLRDKSSKRNRLKSRNPNESFLESPSNCKFVRQTSKKLILRDSQKGASIRQLK